VQKIVDARWRRETRDIYAGYAVYHQAEGAEQAVFDPSSGAALPRSLRLMNSLRGAVALPDKGRMLDIGCGNGATLRAFGQIAPGWSLAGTELDDRCRRQVECLPHVEALYTCPPDQVPGSFHVVTMVHVLEHIPAPGPFLVALLPKIVDGGLLVLELPHHAANPFELLIADHCTHFTAATAAGALESAGYEVLVAAEDWVPKELSLVARKPDPARVVAGTRRVPSTRTEAAAAPQACVAEGLRWLAGTAAAARRLAAQREIGLLGTSIAATWLFAELEGAVRFFVDEDPSRVGKTHLDRPIYHPSQVPQGSQVFIPLPSALAGAIRGRLATPGIAYHLPPGA